MERKRYLARIKQVLAVCVVFVVLVAVVLIAQTPRVVFAQTTTCPGASTTQAHATLTVTGPASVTAGAQYTVVVDENSAVSNYSDFQLGFAVDVIPTGSTPGASVELARVLQQQPSALTPSTTTSATITWKAPSDLLPGTYQFVPLVLGNGSPLNLGTVIPVTRVSSVTTSDVYLTGAAPGRTLAVNGETITGNNLQQQFIQYLLENPSTTSQPVAVRWQVWTGETGSILLQRSDVTYAQTVDPGQSLTRPFFFDTNQIGDGLLEVTVTSGTLQTTQWLSVTGSNIAGVSVSSFTQTGNKFADMGIANLTVCMNVLTAVNPATQLRVTVSDANHTIVWNQTLTGSDIKTGGYQVKEYAFATHWPLVVTVSTLVNNKEISRYSNTYQP